jgi:tRNA (guanine26-N2/guanine27-N2)-dimethyltransferase
MLFSITPNFTEHPDADPESRKIKLVRFQKNPEKYWGPKARAGTKRYMTPEMNLKIIL